MERNSLFIIKIHHNKLGMEETKINTRVFMSEYANNGFKYCIELSLARGSSVGNCQAWPVWPNASNYHSGSMARGNVECLPHRSPHFRVQICTNKIVVVIVGIIVNYFTLTNPHWRMTILLILPWFWSILFDLFLNFYNINRPCLA